MEVAGATAGEPAPPQSTAIVLVPRKPKKVPLPSLGQFACECFEAVSALLARRDDGSSELSRVAAATSQLRNPFSAGRSGTLNQLRAEHSGRHRGHLSAVRAQFKALAPAVLAEWRLAGGETKREHAEQAFAVFLHECLLAAAQTFYPASSPPRGWKKMVHSAAAQQWASMSQLDRMFYEATAAAAQESARPRRKTKRVDGVPAAIPLEAPSNEEIYGKGEAFAHPFVQELLGEARERVARGADFVVCVRSYGRSGLSSEGRAVPGIGSWTLKALERNGFPKRAELFRRVHIFVSHEDPHFTSGRYEKALGPLWASRVVVGVKGADLQVRFIEACFCKGQHVVVMDDNLLWIRAKEREFKFRELRKRPCELASLFRKAGAEMNRRGAHLWGTSATSNPRFMMSSSGPVSPSLSLIYGAFFGFICLQEEELYTQFGQVKDDVERTLRFWHRDKVVLRFMNYAVRKHAKPGAFKKTKGGISADLSKDGHFTEGQRALQQMAEGFAQNYIRLPATTGPSMEVGGKPQRLSDVGIAFCGKLVEAETSDVQPGKLAVGYVCWACRHRHTLKERCNVCINPLVAEALYVFKEEISQAIGMLWKGKAFDPAVQKAIKCEWHSLSPAQREQYLQSADVKLRTLQWVDDDDDASARKRRRKV